MLLNASPVSKISFYSSFQIKNVKPRDQPPILFLDNKSIVIAIQVPQRSTTTLCKARDMAKGVLERRWIVALCLVALAVSLIKS